MTDTHQPLDDGPTIDPDALDDRPPFYRRPWFLIVAAFVVLAIIFGGGDDDPAPVDAEPVAAEVVTETVTETVTEPVDLATLSDERIAAAVTDQIATQVKRLDNREAKLDAREARLDDRDERLDRRQQRIAGAEDQQAANTFTDGIYVVGRDIDPGTYQTSGDSGSGMGCYAATLTDTGGIIDNDLGSGQRVFTVGSGAARVEFTGGCEWTRQ